MCALFSLAGVVDIDQARLQDVSAGIPVSTRIERALGEWQPDAAILTVPHQHYVPLIELCTTRGIHILKEKPLARSLAEAEEIVSQVERGDPHRVAFHLATQRRQGQVFQTLQSYLAAANSKPRAFEYTYTLGLPRGDQDWRSSRSTSGGGAILDMGYHVLDQLTALFGVPSQVSVLPEAVSQLADDDVENGVVLAMTYRSGLSGTAIIGRHFHPAQERFTVWFDERTLMFDGEVLREITPNGGSRSLASAEPTRVLLHKQLHAFARSCRSDSDDPSTRASLLDVMQTVTLCYASLNSGRSAYANHHLASTDRTTPGGVRRDHAEEPNYV